MKTLMLISALLLAHSTAWGAREMKIVAPDQSQLLLKAATLASDGAGNISAGGRIEAKHGDVDITCQGKAKVYLSNQMFSALEAEGDVEATAGHKKIWCKKLYYEEPRRMITASGEPRVQEGKTTYRAKQRILIYTETGVMKFEPAPQITIDKGMDRAKENQERKSFLGLF
jgi:hypothetical protein